MNITTRCTIPWIFRIVRAQVFLSALQFALRHLMMRDFVLFVIKSSEKGDAER